MNAKPTIGRTVLYSLHEGDVALIKNRRLAACVAQPPREMAQLYTPPPTAVLVHQGNEVNVGDVFPAVVVRVWGESENAPCNLQVHLDGTDILWATSRTVGEGPGHFTWPTRN